MKLHPVFAGICNALIPGLGYILLKERVVFGILLLIGTIAYTVLAVIEPAYNYSGLFLALSVPGRFFEGVWNAAFFLAFGYDAWAIAKARSLHPVIAEHAS